MCVPQGWLLCGEAGLRLVGLAGGLPCCKGLVCAPTGLAVVCSLDGSQRCCGAAGLRPVGLAGGPSLCCMAVVCAPMGLELVCRAFTGWRRDCCGAAGLRSVGLVGGAFACCGGGYVHPRGAGSCMQSVCSLVAAAAVAGGTVLAVVGCVLGLVLRALHGQHHVGLLHVCICLSNGMLWCAAT